MDLPIGDLFTIPEGELSWSFSTAGGPGGQHANRNATRAELSWDFGASAALSEDLRRRLERSLGTRARDGVLTVASSESRSQWRNRQLARRQLAELVVEALRERRRRIPTRTPRSAHEGRLRDKRRRSANKRLRKPPEVDE
ncbi:MAG: aminoacyl-tRNA hydrolase [Acidimicrobiia bacterium]|nr:aminoacyl-tRNA hydrolase [Acidimicrobiia bacterium]NNF10502.1 aminoacyl-tRNA hydrolase [Acidimicrobiia bacterium]NNL70270.1 aminoacyl-tRNA hydrolase [Acidimicrobiia bacterium]